MKCPYLFVVKNNTYMLVTLYTMAKENKIKDT